MPYHRARLLPTSHDTYRCEDRSLLLRWLRDPLLIPAVRRLPHAVTPNHLTLIGHGAMWASAALALFAPGFGTNLLIVLAAGYTIFNAADTLDGLYARESGRTSQLGELLDHGLDPMSLGLVLLTYGIAMREPPWLIVASTATVSSLQFLTYLHGYRVGSVILGEIGIIEGIAVATLVCLAAALGAYEWLTTPVWLGVGPASLVAVAVIVGALPAFTSMRGVVDHPADLVPLAILETIALVWFAVGQLGVVSAGLLALSITVLESMIVTTSRLRQVTLVLTDVPFTVALFATALASVVFDVPTHWQRVAAALLTVYPCARAAQLCARTAVGQQSPIEMRRVGP